MRKPICDLGVLAITAALAWSCLSALAQPAAPPEPQRPRIALVLSGGGARGFAHIGVLRVLREMNVPVDIVVGTSMGCVVGGAFAAGRTIEDLERVVRDTDWDRVLADRPARDELTFRRRDEDILLPSRIEFGVSRDGLSLPPGAADNGALELALARLLPAGMHDRPANDLALAFRSVASDLLTGELVELSDTPLFLAMRASLSVPGVFAPVRVNGRLLVDGGLVRNLPVDMARAMGADIVIAVNVGTSLAPEHELGTSLGVAQQMLRILTEQNVQRSLTELRPDDILITPDLAGVSFMDFRAHERAMQVGVDAARRMAAQLQPLALPPERYAEHERARHAGAALAALPRPLARIEVQGLRHINPAALLAQSGLRAGQSLSAEQVYEAAAHLYGRGDVERVYAEVADVDMQRAVTLHVTEADWARSRLRLGLELTTDFSDSSTFGIVGMHVATSLNDWGAELRTIARIGTRRSLGAEWWQPLGAGSHWYVAPSFGYGAGAMDIFDAGRRVARAGYSGAQVGVAAGGQLADWGDVRVGVYRGVQRDRLLIPEDPSSTSHETGNGRFVQLRIDTLEPIAFPVQGQLLFAEWVQPIRSDAQEPAPAHTQLTGLAAFNFGDWGGHVYGEWARTRGGLAPLRLGGFLRLSGSEALSISGSTVVMGRAVFARRLENLPPTFGGAVRAGFSLEFGSGFAADEPVHFGAMKQAGSGFIMMDTRFGPLYVGAGATRGSGGTFYLFLGPIW